MYFRTQGVILSRRNFGEADRLLTLYTKDYGKLSAIGKGVRRPRSKKAGHLELGNWCKIFVAKGKNLDLLTEVELIKAFGIDEFSQKKANKIYHLLEITDLLTVQNQKNPQVFSLLVSFLKKSSGTHDFNFTSVIFKIKLLAALGFFSSHNLKDSPSKKVLATLENEDFETAFTMLNLSAASYLKLLGFLDSMIENLAQQKLKTARFLSL